MPNSSLATLISGAIFGASMGVAGVVAPSIVVAQMKLENFHMIRVFLAATGSSAIVLRVLNHIGYVNTKARVPQNLGWIGSYDGNIIGGLLMGVGMTLSGSCPGTVYAQIGSGFESGLPVLAGALLGGVLYTGVSQRLKTKKAKEQTVNACLTIQEKAGLDVNLTLLLFEGIIASVIALASSLPSTSQQLFHPLIGGLLIGGTQLCSLVLTKSTLGISGSYEEFGKWFWKITGLSPGSRPPSTSIIFATGVVLGSWALSTAKPELFKADSLYINHMSGIVGGAIMAFGSRLAGGCTSGHGISGMALMGISSIVSVVSMFAGGMISAQLIH
ncbi:hypothetical protein EJ08DRAFT_606182 [Tothia fuscella]|uniref:Sulphur transport domain-containing protein n=1 Tax=Tothia fuscella TaxID=1048955 RepID=A0A9P4U2Q7_9PEZI|nr:hypothetical protein EJ08DRAFT_606182 [Tothia fuscella]